MKTFVMAAVQVTATVLGWAWQKITHDSAEHEWELFQQRNPNLFPSRFYPDGTPMP